MKHEIPTLCSAAPDECNENVSVVTFVFSGPEGRVRLRVRGRGASVNVTESRARRRGTSETQRYE